MDLESGMRHGWLIAMAFALFSLTAQAAGPGAVRKQIEASMRVTGVIEVEADGSVGKFEIDNPDKVPIGVVEFVKNNVNEWAFAPVLVGGKPVGIRNKVSMRIVAKKLDDGQYMIRMQAASFDPCEVEAGSEVSSKLMAPPRYPQKAAKSGVSGTVYLALKVGRDGRVDESIVEQVNLTFVASENEMAHWRENLSRNAVAAAKDWSFHPPVTGSSADDSYWVVRVPVSYSLGGPEREYGKWRAYVPGPRQAWPWSGSMDTETSPEALADGGVHQLGKEGLRLLTPLGGES